MYQMPADALQDNQQLQQYFTAGPPRTRANHLLNPINICKFIFFTHNNYYSSLELFLSCVCQGPLWQLDLSIQIPENQFFSSPPIGPIIFQ